MTNIIVLLLAVFLGSYGLNRFRGVQNPAKEALIPTTIICGVFVLLGAIVYASLK